MTTIFRRRENIVLSLAMLCFLITGFSGCSEKVVPSDRAIVTGKVTIDGKAVTGGTISFATKADIRVRTDIFFNKDGTYKTTNAPIGDSFIEVETQSQLNGPKALYMAIPKRYESFSTSGLELDVKAGENKMDLVLTSEPKK